MKVKVNTKFKVHIPERATSSLTLKPLLEKLEMRRLRSENGEGKLALASLRLAVAESLLPN